MADTESFVWVFNGKPNHFPSAVFSTKESAEKWIAKYGLTGILTRYPIDEPVYDWVIRQGFWNPRRDDQKSANFIANFSSAHTGHEHYEDGTGEF